LQEGHAKQVVSKANYLLHCLLDSRLRGNDVIWNRSASKIAALASPLRLKTVRVIPAQAGIQSETVHPELVEGFIEN